MDASICVMLLEKVEAEGFRNLSGAVAPGPGLTILCGENGAGKTNWLEAIHLLATARSFRTARLQEATAFGKELAIVRGRVRRSDEIVHDLQIAVERSSRILSVNGKRQTLQEFLGEFHALVFNSDSLEVVRGHPEARRSFLDDAILALHPPFSRTFVDFTRVIKQKNSLLETARESEFTLEKTAELLAPWNEQLVGLAGRIHRGRTRIVERLTDAMDGKLFGAEDLSIRYVSSLEGKGDLSDYESLLKERLDLRVQAELLAGRALVGPHRDELEILFDGRELRKFGSAGQQRSGLLTLLLASIAVYQNSTGVFPLFLLDDLDAELDHRRIGVLLEFLDGRTQTIVTTSKRSFVSDFGGRAAVFEIVDGRVK